MGSYSKDVSFAHIQKAYNRISPYIHKTPIITCSTLNKLSGRQLFLKAENFQKTGSFKARGGLNAVLSAKEKGAFAGIVTHSSGNHGQGVAYACQISNVPCTVVVPEGTSEAKIRAIKNYGAEVEICAANPVERAETCQRIAHSTGRLIVHPYDNYDVIAGQGTLALELMEQVPNLDAIITPVSGGGLASGTSITVKNCKPSCKIFVAEPYGKELGPCLESKHRLWSDPPKFIDTIGDGIRIQQVGNLTFPIICDLCESQVFTIKNEEMIAAMKLLWERTKIVAEVSSCITLAAALSQQMQLLDPKIKKIGLVLSGGNVDLDRLPWM